MRQPQKLAQINSEYPKNLVEALNITIQTANNNAKMGIDYWYIEVVIEALLGSAIFAGLAIECPNKYFVESYVKEYPESGMLFIHKTEEKYFFIASSFINSLNFKEHATRILGR